MDILLSTLKVVIRLTAPTVGNAHKSHERLLQSFYLFQESYQGFTRSVWILNPNIPRNAIFWQRAAQWLRYSYQGQITAVRMPLKYSQPIGYILWAILQGLVVSFSLKRHFVLMFTQRLYSSQAVTLHDFLLVPVFKHASWYATTPSRPTKNVSKAPSNFFCARPSLINPARSVPNPLTGFSPVGSLYIYLQNQKYSR